MNGITLTLRALHHGEQRLADELTAVAERHRTEHEVHHVATDLARWSCEHVRRLADAGRDHGLDLTGPAGPAPAGPEPADPDPGLLLLRDLRGLHLTATENSLDWEMLAQAAQATRDDKLLALASACHPRTLRQLRWTNTMIKNLSPQILASL